MSITHSREFINSHLAAQYLEMNKKNRTMSKRAVDAYIADMIAGRWEFTGDPIKFDVNGHLLDGQHRLTAIAQLETDEGFEFLVVRGLPTQAQLVMDVGKRRTVGDQLGLQGVRNANHVAASVRLYLQWQRGHMFSRPNSETVITGRELQEWIEEHPDVVDIISADMARTTKLGALPRVAAAFMLRAREINGEYAEEFLHGVYSLVGLEENDPRLTLHRRLMRIRRDDLNLNLREQLALFIQAWNKYVRAEKTSQYLRPNGGVWTAANFPVMDLVERG